MFVAFARITPVQDKDGPIRTATQFHPAKPGIRGDEEVFIVFGDVTTSLRVPIVPDWPVDRGSSA